MIGATPDGGPAAPAHLFDAQNPRARAYAFQQLKRYGVPIPAGTDPAAAWRAASANIFGGQTQSQPQPEQMQPGLADFIRRVLVQAGGQSTVHPLPAQGGGPIPRDALARAAANLSGPRY